MIAGPLARTEGLLLSSLGDEIVVYDSESDAAHALSADAARVWRVCDGQRSLAQIADALDCERELVELAVDELAGCGLLMAAPAETTGAGAGDSAALDRRDMLVRTAVWGGVGALVTSLALPAAAAAASPSSLATVTATTSNAGVAPLAITVSPTTDYPNGSSGSLSTADETAFFGYDGASEGQVGGRGFDTETTPCVELEYIATDNEYLLLLNIETGTPQVTYTYTDSTNPDNNAQGMVTRDDPTLNYSPGDSIALTFTFTSE